MIIWKIDSVGWAFICLFVLKQKAEISPEHKIGLFCMMYSIKTRQANLKLYSYFSVF